MVAGGQPAVGKRFSLFIIITGFRQIAFDVLEKIAGQGVGPVADIENGFREKEVFVFVFVIVREPAVFLNREFCAFRLYRHGSSGNGTEMRF